MMAEPPVVDEAAGALPRPPKAVLRLAEVLDRAGHEVWCVGGGVRDALLGEPHLDWDLATSATPPEVRRLFRRTVPIGIEFGTVGVLDDEGRMHEVTTFRHDVHTDGRHAVVEFGASLDEDLARRDFTINAIAYHPLRRVLHDPFGGRLDLERGRVRAVGDASARMREDRLRALRAIRFASRFDFEIEPETWAAIVESAPHMGRLSAERVKQELDKTFEQARHAGSALRRWRESGALRTLLPALDGVSDETWDALDCLPRAVGRRAHERRLVRHAALLAELPGPARRAALKGLRFSNADTRTVLHLTDRWQELGGDLSAVLEGGEPTPAQVRRWVARVGRPETAAFVRLAAARWAARRGSGAPAPAAPVVRRLHRGAVRSAYRDPVAVGDLAIGGDELRQAGVRPGPDMARILHALLDWVLEDPRRNTVAALLPRARELAGLPPDDRDGAAHDGEERGTP